MQAYILTLSNLHMGLEIRRKVRIRTRLTMSSLLTFLSFCLFLIT